MTGNKKNKPFCLVYPMMIGLFFLSLTLIEQPRKIALADDEIKEVEKDIDSAEEELEEKKEEKLKISNELGAIRSNITVIKTEINKTEEEIEQIEQQITDTEGEIEKRKEQIADALRKINQLDVEIQLILLGNETRWSDYFLMLDDLDSLQDQLKKATDELEQEKEQHQSEKEEQEKVYELHQDQKQSLEYENNRKATLLNQTEASISQLEGKINKLKAELTSLLGKGYDAKDIKDAAKFASKATGTRKDFILGMLVVESDLGRYTGGCDYKESRMNSYRKDIFKDICKELDYNYKKMKVSCPPKSYSGTGGAMGVAQFMPDTWRGYQNSIAAATGHNPPDPWNLTDGVTAMALKLAKVPGVTKHKKSAECDAAKLYLSGTTASRYDWYCDKVLYWADNYEKLL